MSKQSNIESYLKQYLNYGLAPIPIAVKENIKKKKLDKIPLIESYTSKKYTLEELTNCKYFSSANGVGLSTGALSGSLEVIDIDSKYDLTGKLWEEVRELIENTLEEETFKSLVIAQTPSKGYHIYYRSSKIDNNQPLARRPATEEERAEGDKIKVLLETRGEGGYIATYPSPGYTLLQGDFSSLPTISPEERDKIIAICRSFNQVEEDPKKQYKAPTGEAIPGNTPMNDYNQRGDIVGLLESHGWTVVKEQGERIHLLRPGDTSAKTSGNFHTGLKKLVVFSSSTEFEPGQAYSPVDAFLLLECAGDEKLAYRRLLELGYGEPIKGEKVAPTTASTKTVRVDSVNTVNRESSVITEPGETLKIEAILDQEGDIVVTSPGAESRAEVLKVLDVVEQTGKRVYVVEGEATEVRSYQYRLQAILLKYGTKQEEQGELLPRDIDQLLEEVVKTSTGIDSPLDRDIYRSYFLEHIGVKELGITEESLALTMDRLTATRDKEKQTKNLQRLLKKVEGLETGEALEELATSLKSIQAQDKNLEFSKLQEKATLESTREYFQKTGDSLKSGYSIEEEDLLLPAGALTGIAGATGHGKTDLLINLALNCVKEYPSKTFYFFTYEMSQEAILVRFINTYLDTELNKGGSNQRVIKDYLKTGSTQYIRAEARDSFIAEVDSFFTEIIGSGRLKVKGIDFTAPDLNLAMEYLVKKENVGGFFIDYLQLLKAGTSSKKWSRQEELKEICQDLHTTAKNIKLPIILGAQFNREVISPLRMHPTKIGEAGDIERILDTLLGIWNTSKSLSKEVTGGELKEVEAKGLTIPNHLFIKVLKSRETASEKEGLIEYSGKKGVIKEQEETETKDLF